MQLRADAPHVELAIVSDETDCAADDGPADAVLVRCDALPVGGNGGGGTSSDAHSAAGGGDWRTATLRVGGAYPAEAPCVEFQSGASGFGSRQASTVCRNTVGYLSGNRNAGVCSGLVKAQFWPVETTHSTSPEQSVC